MTTFTLEQHMPTQGRPPQTPEQQRPTPAAPQSDATQEDQRDLSTGDEESEDGNVEIGDPVPEDNRTIRAGETGEDEDLPDDDGDIERSTSSRH
jgi:hypothetical protein